MVSAERDTHPIMPTGTREASIGDMSREFHTRPPQAYLRLGEMRDPKGGETGMPAALGEMLRVLAASRPGGVFLCLGLDAGEAGAWIIDGMDLSSRLVIVLEDAEHAARLREVIADDLRVTVHVQGMAEFLADVREHRFDLIADLGAAPCPARTRLSLGRLGLGGLYVCRWEIATLQAQASAPLALDDADEAAPDLEAFVATRLPAELGVTLMAHRPPRPPGKRRGGRRTRGRVTPLFSSRPRGGGN